MIAKTHSEQMLGAVDENRNNIPNNQHRPRITRSNRRKQADIRCRGKEERYERLSRV